MHQPTTRQPKLSPFDAAYHNNLPFVCDGDSRLERMGIPNSVEPRARQLSEAAKAAAEDAAVADPDLVDADVVCQDNGCDVRGYIYYEEGLE